MAMAMAMAMEMGMGMVGAYGLPSTVYRTTTRPA